MGRTVTKDLKNVGLDENLTEDSTRWCLAISRAELTECEEKGKEIVDKKKL